MTTTAHAAICIVLPGDRVVLQFRDEHTSAYPLSFTNWGGSIEEGETPLDCACRELQEELGLQVDPAELSFIEKDAFSGVPRSMFLLRKDIRLADLRLGEGAGFVCIPRGAAAVIPMNDLLKNDLEKLDKYLSSL